MRRRHHGRRWCAGLVTAGLVAAVPLPAAAHAATGTARDAAHAPRAAAAAANLALGRPVTAGGAHGGYPAANVTDGSQASYWEGPAGSFPQWVQIDLGATADVDEVVLKLPAQWEARTETLAVQGSTDGREFTTLAAGADRRFDPASGNTVTVDVAGEARHIRVHITRNTGWNAAQLSEVEIRGETGDQGPGEPPPPGTNLALRKPIEASSHTQDYIAPHANDGSTSTYWEASGQTSTLTAKLGSDADLTGVVVKLNPDPVWSRRTQTIEVLGRKAGAQGFTSLKARADYVFGPAENRNTVTIPVTGRYADVRLAFSGNTGAPGGQVAEFEVVGTAAPAPDLTVTDLTWSPASPSEADPVTVEATVRNAGTAASPATTVDVSLEGTVAGSAEVGELAAGASAKIPVRTGKRPAGSYTVSAAVDPSGTVTELDDTNNSRNAAARLVVGRAPAPTWRSRASPPGRRPRPSAPRSPSPSRCATAARPRPPPVLSPASRSPGRPWTAPPTASPRTAPPPSPSTAPGPRPAAAPR